jgi:hypothetical protein
LTGGPVDNGAVRLSVARLATTVLVGREAVGDNDVDVEAVGDDGDVGSSRGVASVAVDRD